MNELDQRGQRPYNSRRLRRISGVLGAVLSLPVLAQPLWAQAPRLSASQTQAFYDCANLNDKINRLICYDLVLGVEVDEGEGDVSAQPVIAPGFSEARLSFSQAVALLSDTPKGQGGWRYLLRYRETNAPDSDFITLRGASYTPPGSTSSELEIYWGDDERRLGQADGVLEVPQFFALADEARGQSAQLLLSCEDGIESVRLLLHPGLHAELYDQDRPTSWVAGAFQVDNARVEQTRMRWSSIAGDAGLLDPRGETGFNGQIQTGARSPSQTQSQSQSQSQSLDQTDNAGGPWFVLRFGRGQPSAALLEKMKRGRRLSVALSKLTSAGEVRGAPKVVEFDLGAETGAIISVVQSIQNACGGTNS